MSLLPFRTDTNSSLSPSGDHVGPLSSPGPSVSCFKPEPSVFTTYISPADTPPPDTRRANAILEPFGDHAGAISEAPLVSLISSEASAFMTWSDLWAGPLRSGGGSDTYAIRELSGDQAGLVSGDLLSVNLFGPDPSASMTKISRLPSHTAA